MILCLGGSSRSNYPFTLFFELFLKLQPICSIGLNHGIVGREPVGLGFRIPAGDRPATPGGAVSQLRLSHIRVPPQVRVGGRRNLSVARSINVRGGDHLGLRAPLSEECGVSLEAAKAGVGVPFASSFFVSSMDMLAEEFGNLTPEQLAAPIATVEVRVRERGERKGPARVPRRRCPESVLLGAGRAGPRLLRMLRPPPGAPCATRPPLASERRVSAICPPQCASSSPAAGSLVGPFPVFMFVRRALVLVGHIASSRAARGRQAHGVEATCHQVPQLALVAKPKRLHPRLVIFPLSLGIKFGLHEYFKRPEN